MTPAGLLHSDTHGSMPTYGSPWLFAVSRVLRRLLVPRHSPCALSSLTFCEFSSCFRPSLSARDSFRFTFLASFLVQFSRCNHGPKTNLSAFTAYHRFALILFVLIPLVGLSQTTLCLGGLTPLRVDFVCLNPFGGLKWTRTTDLTLIRRAL